MLKLLRGRNEPAGTARLPRVVDDLAALAAGCCRGDTDATATLLSALGPSVLQMVRRVLGAGDPDVEDVFQESLLAVVRALPSFRSECSTRHFACRIATLTALKARRGKHSGFQEVLPVDDEEPGGAEQPDFALASCRRRVVRQLLDELPGAQAEALVLHYVAGMTVEEIAGAASTPSETVRSRLRLAKGALRERIASDPSLLELLEDSP